MISTTVCQNWIDFFMFHEQIDKIDLFANWILNWLIHISLAGFISKMEIWKISKTRTYKRNGRTDRVVHRCYKTTILFPITARCERLLWANNHTIFKTSLTPPISPLYPSPPTISLSTKSFPPPPPPPPLILTYNPRYLLILPNPTSWNPSRPPPIYPLFYSRFLPPIFPPPLLPPFPSLAGPPPPVFVSLSVCLSGQSFNFCHERIF